MMHVHGNEDGVSLRESCDLVTNPPEDCLFCLTKMVAGLGLEGVQEAPHADVTSSLLRDDVIFSNDAPSFGARAPPLFG